MAKEMTFKELYEIELKKPTAAQEFVREIAELTCSAEATVRMWLCGKQTPSKLVQSIIAKRFKVDANSLFPTEA